MHPPRARLSVRLPGAAIAVAAWLAFAATAAAVRPRTFSVPVPPDTGAYLYIGRLLFDGGTPYVDAIDNKGPLTYALFGLIDRIGGDSSLAVRLALVAFAGVAALGVAGYVGRLSNRAAGVAAGLTFAVLGSRPWEGASPNTEQFGVAPMALAWGLSTRAGLASAAGAGALVATATLLNVGFVVCALPVAFELLRAQPRGRRATALAAAFAAGALVGGVALAWLAWRGALAEMLRHSVGFGADPLGDDPEVRERFGRRAAVPHGSLVVAGLVGCLAATGSRRYRAVGVGAAVWTVVMLARAKLSPYDGPLFEHHYYPLTPGIAAGLAAGGAALWSDAPLLPRPVRAAVLVAGATLLTGHYVVAAPDRLVDRWGRARQHELVEAAAYVRSHTSAQDRIVVSGFAPQVYWFARRTAASPLIAVPRFGEVGRYRNYATVYRPRRLADLLRRPPAAIVLPRARADDDIRVALSLLTYRRALRSCQPGRRRGRICAEVWMRRSGARPSWTERAIERQLAALRATCWARSTGAGVDGPYSTRSRRSAPCRLLRSIRTRGGDTGPVDPPADGGKPSKPRDPPLRDRRGEGGASPARGPPSRRPS